MIKSKFIAVLLFAIFISVYSLAPPAHAKEEGKLYVIGMGPAGPDLTAPRGLAVLEKADIFLCPPYIQKNFPGQIDPAKVAFDPWEGIHGKEACQLRKINFGKWLQRVEK